MHRVTAVMIALASLTLVASCASDPAASPPAATSSPEPARCVVSDPQGELIVQPGSLTAGHEVTLEGVELESPDNLDVVHSYTVAFSGSPTVRGVILDYPPLENAGLADSLADWDQRRPLEGRRLTSADGQQAVLVVLRLSDPGRPGHLTGVGLRTDTGGEESTRTYPQPLLVKPHGRPCTVDDIASTKSWIR